MLANHTDLCLSYANAGLHEASCSCQKSTVYDFCSPHTITAGLNFDKDNHDAAQFYQEDVSHTPAYARENLTSKHLHKASRSEDQPHKKIRADGAEHPKTPH